VGNQVAFAQFCAAALRKGAQALCLTLCALGLGLSANAQDRKTTIITFDVPSAATGPGQGTSATVINPAGVIAGHFRDANGARHGFLRAPDGTFTLFDAPGAGTEFFQGTRAYSINPAGAVAGWYTDASNVAHGYLRAPDGNITTFDAPGAGGAGTGRLPGTSAYNINPAGVIAGIYTDVNYVFHSFVRTPDGTITTFDVPGASTSSGLGTFAAEFDGINPAGAITGNYTDASGVSHGYVRAPDGAITVFDVPGAGTGGINPAGSIVGGYMDASGVNHGFVRAAGGTFSVFDVPGAGTGPGQGTSGGNINTPGDVDGIYVDATGVSHGFVRSKHDTITTFDAPGAGTSPGQGTTLVGTNNPRGAITGSYLDANNVFHSFLRIP